MTIGAIATFCVLLVTLYPAWGQSTSPAKLEVPVPSMGAPNAAEVATGDVYLDGRKLFAIAAPAVRPQTNQTTTTPPIRERVEKIETTLASIANSAIAPDALKVSANLDHDSRLPVLYVGDRYLLTVTTLDAQLQGQSPEQRANDLTQTLKQALVNARQERQLDSLGRAAGWAVLLLLGMVVASWVVKGIQRRLKKRLSEAPTQLEAPSSTLDPHRLQPGSVATILVVQTQIRRRLQRNLDDAQRRLWQLVQIGIWSGGSYMLLGLFPYTRWLQPLVFSKPLQVFGIVLLTYAAMRVFNVLIDRSFSALTDNEILVPDRSQRLALRVSTFSRVLRSVVAIALVGLGVLSILSVLGVELGPVLAGAGLLGLALSLASQNLIKDMINGLLILAEDQYAVGDMIQIGKASGLVEYMNLRITQLRNAEGRLITIPNSAITVVENLSKDWSRVDLAITIAYDSDVDQAIAVIKQVSHDLSQDQHWQSMIPEPPQVLGVEDLGNEGITLRIWIKTIPLAQWNVAREFRRRLKRALDDADIPIGLPQQSLWFHGTPEIIPPEDGLKPNQPPID